MDENGQPAAGRSSVERPSSARTSQACQRCRNLKTRCLPSEQSGTCQRCFTSKRECQWAEIPKRAKKLRGPSRISQVERKIDGLVASLINPEAARPVSNQTVSKPDNEASVPPPPPPSDRPAAPGSWIPFPISFDQDDVPSEAPAPETERDQEPTEQFVEKLRMIHDFNDDTDLSRPPKGIFQATGRNERPINHEIVKELLASGEADKLLDKYRSMLRCFPFVPIQPTTPSKELSTTKPMLFLAIMTVASWDNHKRQMSLDKLYREELANRTIIRPRRTLSLVQGTVVYLAWYHFVFSHRTQQIYSLLQQTIGVGLDLGLHQKTKRMPIEMPGRPTQPLPSPYEQRERQRTLLGLYHLSSAVAIGLLKPHLLRFNDYMAECCKTLQNEQDYESDELIDHLVSLRRIDDQISDAFYAEDSLDLPITDSRTSMTFRFVSSQLEDWKRLNNARRASSSFDLSFSFTSMQLHAIALRPTQTSQPLNNNSTQINALLTCLEAGRRFFDTLLNLPVSEYYHLSMPEWMRLPYVIIAIARLCIPSEEHNAAQWDVTAAQDRVRLDLYLESICYRMQSLQTFDGREQKHPDFWYAMRTIMDVTRLWYCRKIRHNHDQSPQPAAYGFPTPNTMQDSSRGETDSAGEMNTSTTTLEAGFPMASMGSVSMCPAREEPVSGDYDPFAFMRNIDFDMEQFLDVGIWGHESYEGLGFGPGSGAGSGSW